METHLETSTPNGNIPSILATIRATFPPNIEHSSDSTIVRSQAGVESECGWTGKIVLHVKTMFAAWKGASKFMIPPFANLSSFSAITSPNATPMLSACQIPANCLQQPFHLVTTPYLSRPPGGRPVNRMAVTDTRGHLTFKIIIHLKDSWIAQGRP
jgi:hypothetical protein